MRNSKSISTLAAALGLLAPLFPQLAKAAPARKPAAVNLAKIPLSFEPAGEPGRFVSRGPGFTMTLAPGEALLQLRGSSETKTAVRMKAIGARSTAALEGTGKQNSVSHYYFGSDPAKWRTNIAHYAQVRQADAYPGIDLVWYGHQNQLEYDFVVAPGADASRIRLGFEGIDRMKIDAQGNLVLSAKDGQMVQHRPVVYQEIDGARREVAGKYVMRGRREVGFQIASYDATRPLVIDPVLAYSSYLGGMAWEIGEGVALDPSDNIYLTGYTHSPTFPGAPGAAPGGPDDVYVTKLNPSGSAILYSVFLGGSTYDEAFRIVADAAGNAYVCGHTDSVNFPVLNASQATYAGGGADAFITKLTPFGTIAYSTYLGGSVGYERAHGIAIDLQGNAYITGFTGSTDFPTVNPIQSVYGGGASDGFVAKFSPSGQRLWSTYLGGAGDDDSQAIAVDDTGVYLGGNTLSTDFPAALNPPAPPYQATSGGGMDSFAAKMDLSGTKLLWRTYLGGSGYDAAIAVAVDPARNVYLGGLTTSYAFYPNSFGTHGSYDAFAAKLNSTGSALIYGTVFGGSAYDAVHDLRVDDGGNAYIAGSTNSTDFPLVQSLYSPAGDRDAFAAMLNPTGTALIYSTTLGSNTYEEGLGVAGRACKLYITGTTWSANFPLVNSIQPLGGPQDAFVSRIDAAGPDLSLTMSGPVSVASGSIQTYTMTVTNLGPMAANSVVVSDSLPAGTTFLSCVSTLAGICGGSGNNRTVTFPLMPMGASASITIEFKVNDNVSAGVLLSNTAMVSSADCDPVGINNSATSVAVSMNPAPTISCPANITVPATSANGAIVNYPAPSVSDNTPGAVTVCTPASGSQFPVGSTPVNCTTTDAGNATASCGFNVNVLSAADVAISMLITKTPDKNTKNITYTIKVKNNGPNPATNVVMTDATPLGTLFASVSGASCAAPPAGNAGSVACNLGTLASGATAPDILFTVTITAKGNTTILNTGSVSSATLDTIPANNSASATISSTGSK